MNNESSSFSKSQLEARTKAYLKYQQCLDKIEKTRATFLHQTRGQIPPMEIMRAKSAEANRIVLLEENKSLVKMYKKAAQFLDLVPVPREVVKAQNKFNEEMKNAQFSFENKLAEAKDNFKIGKGDYWKKSEWDLKKERVESLDVIEKAWDEFNENVKKYGEEGEDLKIAVYPFKSKIKGICKDFKNKALATRKIFEKAVEFPRGFLGTPTFDGPIEEYERAVSKAVEEFQWWAQSAVEFFCLKIDEFDKKKKQSEKLTNAVLAPIFEKTSEDKMAQRLENLEWKMSKVLANMTEINKQLRSDDEVQELPGKDKPMPLFAVDDEETVVKRRGAQSKKVGRRLTKSKEAEDNDVIADLKFPPVILCFVFCCVIVLPLLIHELYLLFRDGQIQISGQ